MARQAKSREKRGRLFRGRSSSSNTQQVHQQVRQQQHNQPSGQGMPKQHQVTITGNHGREAASQVQQPQQPQVKRQQQQQPKQEQNQQSQSILQNAAGNVHQHQVESLQHFQYPLYTLHHHQQQQHSQPMPFATQQQQQPQQLAVPMHVVLPNGISTSPSNTPPPSLSTTSATQSPAASSPNGSRGMTQHARTMQHTHGHTRMVANGGVPSRLASGMVNGPMVANNNKNSNNSKLNGNGSNKSHGSTTATANTMDGPSTQATNNGKVSGQMARSADPTEATTAAAPAAATTSASASATAAVTAAASIGGVGGLNKRERETETVKGEKTPVAIKMENIEEDQEAKKAMRAERNRQSAAASRERKKHHIRELERRVKLLSQENAQLQVDQLHTIRARLQKERELLQENQNLKRTVVFKDMEIAALSAKLDTYRIEDDPVENKTLKRPQTWDSTCWSKRKPTLSELILLKASADKTSSSIGSGDDNGDVAGDAVQSNKDKNRKMDRDDSDGSGAGGGMEDNHPDAMACS